MLMRTFFQFSFYNRTGPSLAVAEIYVRKCVFLSFYMKRNNFYGKQSMAAESRGRWRKKTFQFVPRSPLFLLFVLLSFILFPLSFLFHQINQSVAASRNAFMVWHVMRQLKFYAKLMLIHRPNHSNGHLTIRQKHLKCRKVITESIHHKHQRSRTRPWRYSRVRGGENI